MSQNRQPVRKRREQGFSLPMVAVSSFVLLGMMGLAFDLGRVFITKSEVQAFADAAALEAVALMDGTQGGIAAANTAATQGPLSDSEPNSYNFDTTAISTVTATYSSSFTGTYDSYATASAPSSNTYRFIKIVASASVPLNFLPVLPGIATSMTVSASAIGGQEAQSSFSNGGLEPFMPDAHDPSDLKNFGLTPGVEYTLKWGNHGSSCAGDQGWSDPNPAPQHGFVDLGQGNGNGALTQLIEWGGYPNTGSTPSSVYAGMALSGIPGNSGTQIFNHLNARAGQDTDDSSTTYSAYVSGGTGNGRRVVIVPIGDPTTWNGSGNGTENVIGFASFFLDTGYSGNSGAICAAYIGPANLNGNGAGASDSSKVYYNVLFQ